MDVRPLVVSAIAVLLLAGAAVAQPAEAPPRYRVDAAWPMELPNDWIMGQVGGLTVDSQDHVWVLQRPRSATPDELGLVQNPPVSQCCATTPAVLEFDRDGKLVQGWGGAGHVPAWPGSEHAIRVDAKGNVWIGGGGAGDRQVLKFTRDGKLLLQIGRPSTAPRNNQDTTLLGQPAGIEIDEAAREVYVADGYLNNRIVVFDSETGTFKRGWGAYGIPLDQISNADPVPYAPTAPRDRQFRSPVHCVHLSKDGLLYVCDRVNARIQVFTRQGKFQKEFIVRPETLGPGSVWDLAFSSDAKQSHLLVADGTNNVIWVLRREDGAVLSSFGHKGRNAGQFHWVHQIGTDSRGNLYAGEVDSGKRVQKFVPEGAR